MDIRTLAAHLGLSIGTVSRALSGRRDVNAETRARAVDAAQTLGYAPNQAGRALRRKSTGTVAFLLPLVADSVVFGDPFFLAVLEGVQAELERSGLELIVLLVRPEQDALAMLQRHLGRGIADGWILTATQQDDARIALLVERGIPFVTLGRSDTPGDYASIDLDFETMVDTAMARFISAGHQRIALITSGPGVNFSHLAIARYRAALQHAGLRFDAELLYAGRVNAEHCAIATTAFLALPHPPTAIFVMSENGPVGVYGALREAGMTPGQDIAVIGQRRTPACAALTPSLACFALSLRDLGEDLARALVMRSAAEVDRLPAATLRLWPLDWVEGASANWHRLPDPAA